MKTKDPNMSPLDFPGSPALRRGPDLRDMSRIDMTKLVAAMTACDVVVVVYPEDGFRILKGEPKLKRISDSGNTVALSFLILQVGNDNQAEMVAGALQVGQMTQPQIDRFRDLLTSVQDVRGRRN